MIETRISGVARAGFRRGHATAHRGVSGQGRSTLRVTQVCASPSGAIWLADISEGLKERGYEVSAIIGACDGALADRLRSAAIPFAAMEQKLLSDGPRLAKIGSAPVVGRARLLADAALMLRRAGRMARLFRRFETDLETAHMHSSMVIARLAALLAGTPIRTSMVPGPFHLESPTLFRPDRLTHRIDHLIIGGSEMITDRYRELGVADERLAHTYYGPRADLFDPSRFQRLRSREKHFGISDETPLIGLVAYFRPPRFERRAPDAIRGRGLKGHEDFIAAAALVHQQRPDVQFALVGNGVGEEAERYRRALERSVRDRGLGQVIRFLGERNDVAELLLCFDVAVQCSLLENLGGTIEALLMARPTIATRVGGMPESVRHCETGLLVEPRRPDQLASAMLKLVEDRELGRRLGRHGRELMLSRFTLDRTLDDLDRFYRALARGRGLPQPPARQ